MLRTSRYFKTSLNKVPMVGSYLQKSGQQMKIYPIPSIRKYTNYQKESEEYKFNEKCIIIGSGVGIFVTSCIFIYERKHNPNTCNDCFLETAIKSFGCAILPGGGMGFIATVAGLVVKTFPKSVLSIMSTYAAIYYYNDIRDACNKKLTF